jgi:acyl-coenzyme A synthetase/AMP-(fatty) acid ligase
MLACARLGIIHSQVFGGFSGKACADRIVDSGSRVLITMDAYYRSGALLNHKEKADIAVKEAGKDGQVLESFVGSRDVKGVSIKGVAVTMVSIFGERKPLASGPVSRTTAASRFRGHDSALP